MLLNKANCLVSGQCHGLSSSLFHCPSIALIQGLVQFTTLIALGFSFDSKFIPLGLMAKFSFPIGTFILCGLELTTYSLQVALCNYSDLWDSFLVLAIKQRPSEGQGGSQRDGIRERDARLVNYACAKGKWRMWQKNLFIPQFHRACSGSSAAECST